jgi:hypothetical protein
MCQHVIEGYLNIFLVADIAPIICLSLYFLSFFFSFFLICLHKGRGEMI